jgi:hypothetical protein
VGILFVFGTIADTLGDALEKLWDAAEERSSSKSVEIPDNDDDLDAAALEKQLRALGIIVLFMLGGAATMSRLEGWSFASSLYWVRVAGAISLRLPPATR